MLLGNPFRVSLFCRCVCWDPESAPTGLMLAKANKILCPFLCAALRGGNARADPSLLPVPASVIIMIPKAVKSRVLDPTLLGCELALLLLFTAWNPNPGLEEEVVLHDKTSDLSLSPLQDLALTCCELACKEKVPASSFVRVPIGRG